MKNYDKRLEQFVRVLQRFIDEDYKKNLPNLTPPTMVVIEGRKFDKIVKADSKYSAGSSVWGFIAKMDFTFKGLEVRTGDLMKAATWNAPAKRARGNIFDSLYDGYGLYGPDYIVGPSVGGRNKPHANDSSLDETVIIRKRTRAKKGEKTKAQLKAERALKAAEFACDPKNETYWSS